GDGDPEAREDDEPARPDPHRSRHARHRPDRLHPPRREARRPVLERRVRQVPGREGPGEAGRPEVTVAQRALPAFTPLIAFARAEYSIRPARLGTTSSRVRWSNARSDPPIAWIAWV